MKSARTYVRKTISAAHKIKMTKNLKTMGWGKEKITKFFEDSFGGKQDQQGNIAVSYPKNFKDLIAKRLIRTGAKALLVVGQRGRVRVYNPDLHAKMVPNGKALAVRNGHTLRTPDTKTPAQEPVPA